MVEKHCIQYSFQPLIADSRNFTDIREIAGLLPYSIKDTVQEVTLNNIMDMPTYATVTMLDGSETNMLINYHQCYEHPDPDNLKRLVVEPNIAHTDFETFTLYVNGMTREESM